MTARRHAPAPRAVAALALAAAVGLGAGCRRGPGPVHVSAVREAQGALAEPLREAGLEPGAVEEAARTALGGAGFVMGEGPRTHRAKVDVIGVRLAPGAAGPKVEVAVEIELTPAESGAEDGVRRESGVGASQLGGVVPAEAWRTALRAAAAQAAGGLALGFAEEAKGTEALIADLGDKDARVRGHAVRALADRRDPEAVPALLLRLRDPEPEVVHRAVGALAQLRDPRAVGPLIDLSRRGTAEFTARIARLIGDIGGPEAEGYLLTLASGHADPAVRRAAREALDEMAARQARAPVAGR